MSYDGLCNSYFLLLLAMEILIIPDIGEIKVRRGIHIKYLRIRMAPARGIWVSAPYGVSRKQIERFIEENRSWILNHRKSVEIYEQDTGVGLYLGAEIKTKFHVLKIVGTDQVKPFYQIEKEKVVLSLPQSVAFDKMKKMVQQFLLEIYTLESRSYLPGRVAALAQKFGFKYGRLTFRNNLTNWGSCSYENNISLNIKLMKLPNEIIDYVILHELCHTIEKNHSSAYWKLVGTVCPNYIILRKQLKKYNTRI